MHSASLSAHVCTVRKPAWRCQIYVSVLKGLSAHLWTVLSLELCEATVAAIMLSAAPHYSQMSLSVDPKMTLYGTLCRSLGLRW